MTTSALLRHGPQHLRSLIVDLESWLSARGFASVAQIKGLMRHSHPEAGAEAETQERSNYIQSLLSYRGAYVHG